MKLSKLINKLQKIHDNYGDMQVYAFGYNVSEPHVYKKGDDELFIDFSKAF